MLFLQATDHSPVSVAQARPAIGHSQRFMAAERFFYCQQQSPESIFFDINSVGGVAQATIPVTNSRFPIRLLTVCAP
jgi:hypothetical protein